MSHISQFDPSRNTVGKIYRDLHINPDTTPIPIGDMSNEILPGLLVDLNTAIQANPYDSKPYYILLHEKKDLQMREAILRRVIHMRFRPYPEDDTVVFYHEPKRQKTYFCWCLPHWSEMPNILCNAGHFDRDFVYKIKCWQKVDLTPFGFFTKNGIPFVNPKHKDLLISN